MLRRVVLVCVCYSVLAGAALASEPRDVNFDEVYGTWKGTWIPTLKFTGDRVPRDAPPYPPAAVEFVFREFTADAGSVAVDGALGGIIVGLASSGPNLFATVFYDAEGEPNGYGDLTVTLSGNRFVGRFNERAPTSITHWEGPILLMKTDIVPTEALIGRWQGDVQEMGAGGTPVDMTINSLSVGTVAGAIEYPERQCGGTLTLLSRNGNEFTFLERIREGEGGCSAFGLLVLAVTSDALEFRWFFPGNETQVAVSGSLEKSPFDALNDCPCIPPPDTITPEQSLAAVATLTQNLMDAGDEIPRCRDLRSAFYENYQPDKVQMELDLYSQERHCALNAAGILRDAGSHGTRINGALNDVAVGEAEAAVDTMLSAFIHYYRQVRGLQDLTSGGQSASPQSPQHAIAVTTFLERSFIAPEEALRNKKELLVEATVEFIGDELGVLFENDHFADTFEIRGEQALGVMTVTRLSNNEAFAEVTLQAFLTETPPTPSCAGDCDGTSDVTVNEIITLVNIALGGDVSECRPGDTDRNNEITVDEILTAVNAALSGCS